MMRTLINVVLALVLFGSVPVSAQSGIETLEDWKAVLTIIGVGAVLFWKLYLIERNLKQDSKDAHGRIEGNIKASEDRVTASVKTDVDRIYKHLNESENRITASVQTDVNRIYDQINTLIGMVGKKD